MDRLSHTHESLLNQVVKALKQGLDDRLIAAVLFGSRARGESHEESDWDLLVIARDLPPRPFPRLRFLKAMMPAIWRGRISLLAKTQDEFEASLPALYLDIALDGVVLYDSQGYTQEKLTRLRKLIDEGGLRRVSVGRDFVWQWETFPGFDWTLDWRGVSDGS